MESRDTRHEGNPVGLDKWARQEGTNKQSTDSTCGFTLEDQPRAKAHNPPDRLLSLEDVEAMLDLRALCRA